jgi:hypothetical protein
MLTFDRRREHDNLTRAPRGEREASRRRVHVCQTSQLEAKPTDSDAQSRAMRFVGVPGPKSAGKERGPGDVRGPNFAQRAGEREQDRARRERDRGVGVAHDMAASIDDERSRSEQRLDLLEEERSFLARCNQARGRRIEDEGGAFDLRHQGRNACIARGALSLGKRSTCRLDPDAPHRDACDSQSVGGAQSRRQGSGMQSGGIELRHRALGLAEAPDQQQTPNLEVPSMRRIRPVAMLLEGRPRCIERLGRPGQVARD